MAAVKNPITFFYWTTRLSQKYFLSGVSRNDCELMKRYKMWFFFFFLANLCKQMISGSKDYEHTRTFKHSKQRQGQNWLHKTQGTVPVRKQCSVLSCSEIHGAPYKIFRKNFFDEIFFFLDVMASEASLEHSLLDVMPERSELRAFVFRFG